MKTLKEQILEMSRQSSIGPLSPWFDRHLDELVSRDEFLPESKLLDLSNHLVDYLKQYAKETKINTCVLGMSGGVDSALTAALFKRAGWRVIGVTMPIHQNPEETDRGVEACKALDSEHIHIDLSQAYNHMVADTFSMVDEDLMTSNDVKVAIRRGNIRARLRMITLYNLAAKYSGLVASTDNLSEMITGFWSLHGDVGDLSPIQSLLKSWEVPMLAKLNGVPERIWRAKPTDGLGIAKGDEDQFGFSYLELDIMFLTLSKHNYSEEHRITAELLENDSRATKVLVRVLDRLRKTWFKRYGSIKLPHSTSGNRRYEQVESLDWDFAIPEVLSNG